MQLIVLGIAAAIGLIFFLKPKSASAAISETPEEQQSGFSFLGINMNQEDDNLFAFLALIRKIESQNDYGAIVGGDKFYDYSEHPFIINPMRNKPLGTTASGAYQMVKSTWIMARDALGLTDFSPASQDAAAIWIIKNKRPDSYNSIVNGNFQSAMINLRFEWEAFDKILSNSYWMSAAEAENFYINNGGETS